MCADDLDWLGEAILQMRDVFEKDGLMVECDVVEEHEVLMELAHVADMRDHGDAIENATHRVRGVSIGDDA